MMSRISISETGIELYLLIILILPSLISIERLSITPNLLTIDLAGLASFRHINTAASNDLSIPFDNPAIQFIRIQSRHRTYISL